MSEERGQSSMSVRQYLRVRGRDLTQHVRVSVWRFQPGTTGRVLAEAERHLLPLFRRQPGFIAHQLISTGDDEVTAVSTWDSREGAERSVQLAAAWVAEQVGDLVVSVETRFGEVVVDHGPFHTGAYDAAAPPGREAQP